MHRAHAHIANRQPLEPVQAALLAQHGVEVGQDLGGVFAPSITAVDDRDTDPFGRFVRSSFLEMAHYDHVTLVLEHFKGILDGFHIKIPGPGHLCIGKTGHLPAQSQHG